MELSSLTKEIFEERYPPKRVLFRVDAGRVRGLSFGHLSRCILLAEELERSAHSKTVFLMRDYKEGMAHASSKGMEVETMALDLSGEPYMAVVKRSIESIKPDAFVFDIPDEDPNVYLRYARDKGVFTVCIDDTAERSFEADVILNSSILARRSNYRLTLPNTRLLLGTDYFIMDGGRQKSEHREDSGFSVVISFGGSDPSGLTEKVVDVLKNTTWDGINYTVVLGPGFDSGSYLKRVGKRLADNIIVADNPDDLIGYFSDCDLVICAGGRTLYELNTIGVPAFAVATNGYEARVIEAFKKRGAVIEGMSSWRRDDFTRRLRIAIKKVKDSKYEDVHGGKNLR